MAAPLISAQLPISTGRHVGLALVYSATATQSKRVEDYGKDEPATKDLEKKWNGRIIHTFGDSFTEVEEKLIETRGAWWGEENVKSARRQQTMTDFRKVHAD